MSSWLAKLILLVSGSWHELTAEIERAELALLPFGAAPLVIGTLLALGLAVLCYRTTTEAITTGARVRMAALRFVSLFLLLLLASGAVLTLTLRSAEQPELLVIIDDSPSMTIADGESTRLAAAEQTVDQKLLPKFADTYHTSVVRTSAARIDAGDLPQDLARSTIQLASRGQQRPPARIVLVSDGRQLGDGGLAAAAAELPAPVDTIVVGARQPLEDLLVERVWAPPYVYLQDSVQLTAAIRGRGLSDAADVAVKLLHEQPGGGKEVAQATVKVTGDGEPALARLAFIATASGRQRYTLRVETRAGDKIAQNNQLSFYLDVRDEKIRVLFAEGEPSWEYRYIKQALDADPAVAFHGLVRLPGQEWFYQGPTAKADGKPVIKNIADGIPATMDELAQFDVLILGDLERKVFEKDELFTLIHRFVREQGHGLATIGGMKVYGAGNFHDTLLAEMLPLVITHDKKQHLVNRFNVQAPGQALTHPIMQLEPDPVANQKAWAELPWVEGGNAFRTIRPGATLLLAHPTLKTPSGPRPIAAAWPFGAGKVFSSALDGTWHWRLARESEIDYHKRFWGLAVRWLAHDPRERTAVSSLVCEDAVLEAGLPARFHLLLRDEEGNAVADGKVRYELEQPSARKVVMLPQADPALPGRYGVRLTPTEAGPYVIRVEASVGDSEPNKQEMAFVVAPARAEYLAPEADRVALAALSSASGGTSVDLEDAEKLVVATATEHVARRVAVIDLWRSPGLLGVLIVSLCLEWFWRKRRGLA